jgi:hypothetical protein
MKIVGAVTAAAIFAVLAISPLPAQEEQRNDSQPAAQEKQGEEAKPAPEHRTAPAQDAKPDAMKPPHQDEAKPPRDDRQGDRERPAQDQERHVQQEQQKQVQQQEKDQRKQAEQDQKHQEKQAEQQQHDQQRLEQQDRRSQNERPAAAPEQRPAPQMQGAGPRGGGRIPDDHFRAHFGREHHFRVSRPVIIEGRPRFQYSGYWFEILDPWPVGWSYDDECYIDYVDDGYYLFDPRYPGVRAALVVVF